MTSKMIAATLALFLIIAPAARAKDPPHPWRSLPLIKDGKVDPAWVHLGYGGFVVEDGTLRTECDERGLGLLLYEKEKFGDCQIRVVYKQKDAKSNAGVYVRIDDGILKKIDENHAPAARDASGQLTDESLQIFQQASEKELGPWYAVHHGYEVQICDSAEGKRSRTGAIYSLAASTALPDKRPDEWKTMKITLDGNLVKVEIEAKTVTRFDPDSKDIPADREWYEPKASRNVPPKATSGCKITTPATWSGSKRSACVRCDNLVGLSAPQSTPTTKSAARGGCSCRERAGGRGCRVGRSRVGRAPLAGGRWSPTSRPARHRA